MFAGILKRSATSLGNFHLQDDKDKKRQEQLEKKQVAKKLLEEEMSSIKSSKAEPTSKMTREQIIVSSLPTTRCKSFAIQFYSRKYLSCQQSQLERAKSPVSPAPEVPEEEPLVENLNRLGVDGEEARTIDEALAVLT